MVSFHPQYVEATSLERKSQNLVPTTNLKFVLDRVSSGFSLLYPTNERSHSRYTYFAYFAT